MTHKIDTLIGILLVLCAFLGMASEYALPQQNVLNATMDCMVDTSQDRAACEALSQQEHGSWLTRATN